MSSADNDPIKHSQTGKLKNGGSLTTETTTERCSITDKLLCKAVDIDHEEVHDNEVITISPKKLESSIINNSEGTTPRRQKEKAQVKQRKARAKSKNEARTKEHYRITLPSDTKTATSIEAATVAGEKSFICEEGRNPY